MVWKKRVGGGGLTARLLTLNRISMLCSARVLHLVALGLHQAWFAVICTGVQFSIIKMYIRTQYFEVLLTLFDN